MRVFFTQTNFKFSSGTLFTKKLRKSEYYCEHTKFWRRLFARAFRNFVDNKASKTGFFASEKTEEKNLRLKLVEERKKRHEVYERLDPFEKFGGKYKLIST